MSHGFLAIAAAFLLLMVVFYLRDKALSEVEKSIGDLHKKHVELKDKVYGLSYDLDRQEHHFQKMIEWTDAKVMQTRKLITINEGEKMKGTAKKPAPKKPAPKKK